MKQIARVIAACVVVAACAPKPEAPPQGAAVTRLPSPGIAGSLAPNLVARPDGTVIMSWIEPDGDGHALRYSRLDDGAWTEPTTVSSGDNWFVNWADFPSVVPLADDFWAAHWLARRPAGGYAYVVQVALSSDGGQTWSDPVAAHSDDTDTEHGFVSLYRDGDNAGFVYLDGRKMENEVTDDPNESGMTLRAAAITRDLQLVDEQLVDGLTCDCCQTDVAFTAEGPIVVYRNRTENEIRDIYVTRRVAGEWTQGVPINDDGWEIPGCPVNGPEIHADGNDVVVAWYTAANDSPRVRFARSTDGGRSFSAPLDVADGALLGHVGMTVDASGTAWILWLRNAGDGEAELRLNRVAPDGSLGSEQAIAGKGAVAAFSVPQIVTSGQYLLLAWTEGAYGETNLRTARIATL